VMSPGAVLIVDPFCDRDRDRDFDRDREIG
jgi:hypothetical protein